MKLEKMSSQALLSTSSSKIENIPETVSESSSFLSNLQTRVQKQAKAFDENCNRLSFELRDTSLNTIALDNPSNINFKLEVTPPTSFLSMLERSSNAKQVTFLPWEDFWKETQTIIASNRGILKDTLDYNWPEETSEEEEVQQVSASCLDVSTVSNGNGHSEENNASLRSSFLDDVRHEQILSFLEQLEGQCTDEKEQLEASGNPDDSSPEIKLVSQSIPLSVGEIQNNSCSIQDKATSPTSDTSEAVEVQMGKTFLSDGKEKIGHPTQNIGGSSQDGVSGDEKEPINVVATALLTNVEYTETDEVTDTSNLALLDITREATHEQMPNISIDQHNLSVNVIPSLHTSVKQPGNIVTFNPICNNTHLLGDFEISSEDVAVRDADLSASDNCLNVADVVQQSQAKEFSVIAHQDVHLSAAECAIPNPAGACEKPNQTNLKVITIADSEQAPEAVTQAASNQHETVPLHIVEDDPLNSQQLMLTSSSDTMAMVTEEIFQAPLTTSPTQLAEKEEVVTTPVLEEHPRIEAAVNRSQRKSERLTQQRSRKTSLEEASAEEIISGTAHDIEVTDSVLEIQPRSTSVQEPGNSLHPICTNNKLSGNIEICSEEEVRDAVLPNSDNSLNVADVVQQSEAIDLRVISHLDEHPLVAECAIPDPVDTSFKPNQANWNLIPIADSEQAPEAAQAAPDQPENGPLYIVEDDLLDSQPLTWSSSPDTVPEEISQNNQKVPLATFHTEMAKDVHMPLLDEQPTIEAAGSNIKRKSRRLTQQQLDRISLEEPSTEEIISVTATDTVVKDPVPERKPTLTTAVRSGKRKQKRSKNGTQDMCSSMEEVVPARDISVEMVEDAIPVIQPKPKAIKRKNNWMSKSKEQITSTLTGIEMEAEVVVVEPVPEIRTMLKVSSKRKQQASVDDKTRQKKQKRVSFSKTTEILNASDNEQNSPQKSDYRPALLAPKPFVYRTPYTLASYDPYDSSQIRDDSDSTFENLSQRWTFTPTRDPALSSKSSIRKKPKYNESPTQAEIDPTASSHLSQESPSTVDRDIQTLIQREKEELHLDDRKKEHKEKKLKREKKQELRLQELIRSAMREELRAAFDRLRPRFRPAVRKPRRIIVKKIVVPRRKPSEDKATQAECWTTVDVAINTDATEIPETSGTKNSVKKAPKRKRAPAKSRTAKKCEEAKVDSEIRDVENVPKSGNKQRTLSQCVRDMKSSTAPEQCDAESHTSPLMMPETADICDQETQNHDNILPVENVAGMNGSWSEKAARELGPTKGCYRTPSMFHTQPSNNSTSSCSSLQSNNSISNNASVALVDQNVEQMNGFSQLIDQLRCIRHSEYSQDQTIPNSQQSSTAKHTHRIFKPRRSLKPYPQCPKLRPPVIEKQAVKIVLAIDPGGNEPSLLESIAIGPVNDPGLFPEEYLLYIGKRLLRYHLDRSMPRSSDMYVPIAIWDGQCSLNYDEESDEEDGTNEKAPAYKDQIDQVMFRPVCSSLKSSQEPGRFSPGLSPISHRVFDDDIGPKFSDWWG